MYRQMNLVVASLAVLLASCGPAIERDAADIGAMVHVTFDRPDAALTAEPIVVSGDYGVVDWTQDGRGGRALVRRSDGHWRIVLCAGEGIRTAEGLRSVGVPSADADAIARRLAAAERDVDAARLHQIASFEGVVRMDGMSEHATHQ